MKIIYSLIGLTIITASIGLVLVVNAQPTYPYVGPIVSIGGGGSGGVTSNDVVNIINAVAPTNSGITAAEAATQINDTNVNRIQPVTTGNINTSSNLLWASSLAQINTTSNTLAIPLILGVVTNTAAGVKGVTTAMPGTWIKAASIPITAADTSWPDKTNYYNVTNAAAGNAVVVVGPDANNNFWLKGTNWPSGGSTPNGLVTNNAAADIVVTNATVNTTITSNSVTTGTITANGGPVSLIPTNASPVYFFRNPSGLTMPVLITNTLSGRAQPIVQYFLVDAVGGTPILTASNETTGMKLTISEGASASITPLTNIVNLPITTTNTIWRLRDESAGTGASVGVITNFLIGL